MNACRNRRRSAVAGYHDHDAGVAPCPAPLRISATTSTMSPNIVANSRWPVADHEDTPPPLSYSLVG